MQEEWDGQGAGTVWTWRPNIKLVPDGSVRQLHVYILQMDQ